MITYKDMIFCVDEKCQKRCRKYLTNEIKIQADKAGLPIAYSNYFCTNCGETDAKEMS